MKWASADAGEAKEEAFTGDLSVEVTDDRLAFFDVEVYPNLFVVCWKFQNLAECGEDDQPQAA